MVLLRAKLGSGVRLGKVERVVAGLAKDGRLTGPTGREAWASPGDVDLVEGELRRMRAGWYARRNVRGDADVWLWAGDGTGYVVRVPYERAWSTEQGEELEREATLIGCWEWPTARLTGVMVLVGEEHGLPAYEYRDDDDYMEGVVDWLIEQWMTGAKVRAQ